MNPVIARSRKLQRLATILFREEYESVYAILDGASIPGLLDKLASAREDWVCLYRGALEPSLARMAPYLVKLRRDASFTEWLIVEGWGKHWGVIAVSPAGLEALRRHFRHFLRVRDHRGAVLYFRYYDPRVLRIYLPTCNLREIKTVYGPVSRYITEDEEGQSALVFRPHPVPVMPRIEDLTSLDVTR